VNIIVNVNILFIYILMFLILFRFVRLPVQTR